MRRSPSPYLHFCGTAPCFLALPSSLGAFEVPFYSFEQPALTCGGRRDAGQGPAVRWVQRLHPTMLPNVPLVLRAAVPQQFDLSG